MKRIFDIISSFCALTLLGLPLIIIAIFIKLDSKGPIIFTQCRVGKDDQEFTIYKFRTMVVGTPNLATDKLVNSKNYITKVGYFLRKYSLDELPQLYNILKGDMSVVGPRPALYNQYELRKLRNDFGISAIKPGLTGWAQVNGRDEIPLESKVKFDLEYLQRRSIFFDLMIIYRTMFSVYSGDGVRVNS